MCGGWQKKKNEKGRKWARGVEGKKRGKRRGEERKSWHAVAFSEMLIDVVNTMGNEPLTVTRDKHTNTKLVHPEPVTSRKHALASLVH